MTNSWFEGRLLFRPSTYARKPVLVPCLSTHTAQPHDASSKIGFTYLELNVENTIESFRFVRLLEVLCEVPELRSWKHLA
jgi:hypothetical protein